MNKKQRQELREILALRDYGAITLPVAIRRIGRVFVITKADSLKLPVFVKGYARGGKGVGGSTRCTARLVAA